MNRLSMWMSAETQLFHTGFGFSGVDKGGQYLSGWLVFNRSCVYN